MNRRSFLGALSSFGGIVGAGLSGALAPAPAAASALSDKEWTFVHFTDPHIQKELRADTGCAQAFRAITKLNPDFAVSGGDLAFDTMAVDRPKADSLYSLYKETVKHLEVPVHNVIGNHDVFGLSPKSGVKTTDDKYGKALYEDLFGKRYYSFDHKGWHFIAVDSIGVTPEREYYGFIDPEQLAWLQSDLEKTGTETPVVIITHIPFLSAFPPTVNPPGTPTAKGSLVTNVSQVLPVLKPYKVKAVLQGHTHVCERIEYHDTQYITSGAVSGNWWKGKRHGFDEGFAVLTMKGEEISWRYQTYGWKADVPPAA